MTNTTSLVEIWPTPTDKAWFGGAGIIGEVWGGDGIDWREGRGSVRE